MARAAGRSEDLERRRRREQLLESLAQARALRDRVHPRRVKLQRAQDLVRRLSALR